MGVGAHEGQRSTSSLVPQAHLPCLLRQKAPGLTIRPGWLVSEPWEPAQAWASAPSFSMGAEDQAHAYTASTPLTEPYLQHPSFPSFLDELC